MLVRFIGVDGRIYKIPMPFHGILICCGGEKCLTGPGKGPNAIAHDTVGRKGRHFQRPGLPFFHAAIENGWLHGLADQGFTFPLMIVDEVFHRNRLNLINLAFQRPLHGDDGPLIGVYPIR